ncbi:hypothetical protein [Asticcacaulis sp. MM231]|uniref:hypothetical protein n=1 Tax=Asticcacaulis sp. MM231 TaxID=3157666 RepID=UPI0032D5A2F7
MSVDQIFDEIEFVGEISLAKTSAALILIGLCLENLLNSTVRDHTYYRWLFEPWATPLRIILGMIAVVGIILIARRALQSALRIPAVEVKQGIVKINYDKKGVFQISDIDEMGIFSNGNYFFLVNGKKYGISLSFCSDSKLLRQNLELLRVSVSNRLAKPVC